VDHTQEFVIRDEPSLSQLPAHRETATHQDREFRLYYTSEGYGGGDLEVCEFGRKYLSEFPKEENRSNYRMLRRMLLAPIHDVALPFDPDLSCQLTSPHAVPEMWLVATLGWHAEPVQRVSLGFSNNYGPKVFFSASDAMTLTS
jgi:hypothetical protein